jgi:hypothetical protein
MSVTNLQYAGKQNRDVQLVNSKVAAICTTFGSHTHAINNIEIRIPQSVLRVPARTQHAVFSLHQSQLHQQYQWMEVLYPGLLNEHIQA